MKSDAGRHTFRFATKELSTSVQLGVPPLMSMKKSMWQHKAKPNSKEGTMQA
jgi:hypothetical protein